MNPHGKSEHEPVSLSRSLQPHFRKNGKLFSSIKVPCRRRSSPDPAPQTLHDLIQSVRHTYLVRMAYQTVGQCKNRLDFILNIKAVLTFPDRMVRTRYTSFWFHPRTNEDVGSTRYLLPSLLLYVPFITFCYSSSSCSRSGRRCRRWAPRRERDAAAPYPQVLSTRISLRLRTEYTQYTTRGDGDGPRMLALALSQPVYLPGTMYLVHSYV